MSYLPITPSTLRVSSYVPICINNQLISTGSFQNVGLDGTMDTNTNPFGTTPTISTSTDRITLPAGKYFIQARLAIYRAGSGTWGGQWYIFKRVGASNVQVGYEGRRYGIVHIGDPQMTGSARAYIESDGTTEVGVEAQAITSTITLNSTATYGVAMSGASRLMIWRVL